METFYLCPKCESNQVSIEKGRLHRCFSCGQVFAINIVEKSVVENLSNIRTFEDMTDDPISNGLCSYCIETERGEQASYATPNGYFSCEGRYCERAYRRYVEELEEENLMFNDDEWDDETIEEEESW